MKNEEKYLRDCLNGLKPILEQVHSELIIYDTGSTDASVEIAKEFTDKVYQIEWRGDFAWARNHTVDRAIGKWYMFLDADEIFTDVEDIIEFFNSGEFRNFKSATYRLKNLQGDGNFSYFYPRRMFKKDKDARFAGKIHEYIPAKQPQKNLQSIATHHGYYFTGPNAAVERMKKHERNVVSLLELYEENPKDRRTLYHLINEYFNLDNDLMLRYITEGLDLADGNQKDLYYHVFTSQLVNYYALLSNWESVIDTVRNYFSNLEVEHLNAIQLRVQEAQALIALKRHSEAAEAYEQSYAYFKQNKAGKLDDIITGILPIGGGMVDNETPHISGIVTHYAIAGDLDKSFEHYERYKEESGTDPKLNILNRYTANIVQNKNWDGFANLFAFGLKHGQASDRYNQMIDEIENALTDKQIKQTVAVAILDDEALGDLDIDYIWLQKLRAEYNDALDYFLEADKPLSLHYGDVFVAAMRRGDDVTQLLVNMEIANTPAFIKSIAVTNTDFFDVMLDYVQRKRLISSGLGVKATRILSEIAHAVSVLTANNNDLAVRLRIDIFEAAIRMQHKYLGMVYRNEIYNDEEVNALATRDKVTYFAGVAFDCRDRGDIVDGFIKNMDRVITIDPGLKGIITIICMDMIGSEPTPLTVPAPDVTQAATNEITSLKEAIYDLINKGDRLKAAQILRSYTQINPAAPEIIEIKKAIQAAN
jgi:glycosyltransferase involved in cell wall biosynthesis